MVQRIAGHMSAHGQRWLARLERARTAVERAEVQRDELARQALAAGVGVRGVALGLGIDKATVSRRYGRQR
jgi:hypothetical protein